MNIVRLALLVLLSSPVVLAQEAQSGRVLPDAPVPQQSAKDSSQKAEKKPFRSTLGVLERKSLFFPELAADRGPLTRTQKFELFADESIAPSTFLSSAFGAGIGQARNSLPGYGQEAGGFAKRYGSSMASNASNHFFGTFLLPSLLHHDPRYFVLYHDTFGRKVGYALSRIVLTRTDAGGEAFNLSGILGPLAAEGLANAYLPDNERTAGKTFSRYGIRIGLSTANNLLKEYWPTIFKDLRISKLAPSPQSDPGTVPPSRP
ncbi:MAG: hypothetical protein ACRD50_00395 [Candidatus Acidiferrales bacterium]